MKIFRNSCRTPALLLALSLLAALAATVPATHEGKYIFYVGTYTEEGSKSKGIYAYGYDPETTQITPLGLAAETTNPSWITISPNGRFLYAVNEVQNYKGPNSGGLSAFSIDRDKGGRATGKLTFLNEVATRGADPCYVSVDKTGKYALVANYTGGSVAVFPIREDGSLGEAVTFVQHTGHGTNPQRQEGPHAHSIDLSPDNRFAYVDDLGLDELLVYKFDSAKGSLTPNNPPFAKLDPGSGPRHFALSPDGKFAYVVSEMQGTVTAFSNDAATGTLQRLQTISTLPKYKIPRPEDFKRVIEDAEIEIHPSGKFLYASNRGNSDSIDSNSIAIFTVDAEKGTLTLREITPTFGKTPRSFEIDPTGTRLFVANQQSNNISVFRIDQRPDSYLTKAGHLSGGPAVDVPSPVCVKFLKVE
jgi:6-phosphogluconolactonase